jgi:hypothetical protein
MPALSRYQYYLALRQNLPITICPKALDRTGTPPQAGKWLENVYKKLPKGIALLTYCTYTQQTRAIS